MRLYGGEDQGVADQHQHWDQLQGDLQDGAQLWQAGEQDLQDNQSRKLERTTSLRYSLPFVFVFI
jgi:hypothetical protein